MSLPNDKFDERPYLDLIEEIGPIKVFLVDGEWVRKHLQEEFTNFAHHYTKPKGIGGDAFQQIPQSEFWIDVATDPSERGFFIDRLLTEHYLASRGMSYQKAEQEGNRVEQRERHKGLTGIRKYFSSSESASISEIELRRLQKIKDLEIFVVDGKKVRNLIDPRYCHGGHYMIYDYVPENHEWIDNTVFPREWPYLEVHETHELRDMEDGMSYPEAHKKASRLEWACRWNKKKLIETMKELGLI